MDNGIQAKERVDDENTQNYLRSTVHMGHGLFHEYCPCAYNCSGGNNDSKKRGNELYNCCNVSISNYNMWLDLAYFSICSSFFEVLTCF
jgi:hypothetical protein